MFNSVAFEVTIGLVFVYLLYSLLTTILSEIIATWFGLRARLLKGTIQRMLEDDKGKIKNSESLSKKFYDHPGIKYLGKNRLFQTPSYISADIFSTTLINLFWKKGTAVTVMEEIKLGMSYHDFSNAPETKKQIRSLIEHANGDLNVFKQSIEDWFNEMMDRCTGWYKRQMKLVLLILGFIVAIAFNIDTIKIAKILANNTEIRQQILKVATDPEVKSKLSEINGHHPGINDEKIKEQYDQLNEYALKVDDVLGLGNTRQQWNCSHAGARWLMIFGWLLTALALSLGSPFWFDLLNKLVALRGAGKNTDAESKKTNEVPETKSLTTNLKTTDSGHHIANHVSDDPVLVAIAQYKKTLYAIPGVLAVNKGYETTAAGTKDACVEITVTALCNQASIPTLNIMLNETTTTIQKRVVLGGVCQTNGIKNNVFRNAKNGIGDGTITCLVKDKQKRNSILSCYHVMQGDNKYPMINGDTAIIDSVMLNKLADIYYLFHSETLDVGLAELIPNTTLKNPSHIKGIRSVTDEDGKQDCPVTIYGSASPAPVPGFINQDTVEYPFQYNGIRVMMTNLVRISGLSGPPITPTMPGDSGAIVCDQNGMALGMIIGGIDGYSYAIKLSEIFNALKLELL